MPAPVCIINVTIQRRKPLEYTLAYTGEATCYEELAEIAGKQCAEAHLERAKAAGLNQTATSIEIPVYTEDSRELERENLKAVIDGLEQRLRKANSKSKVQGLLDHGKAHLAALAAKPVKH